MESIKYHLRFICFCIFTGCITSCVSNNQNGDILIVDFEQTALGDYDDMDIKADFDTVKWFITKERGTIINEKAKGNILRVQYPKDAVGPEEGGIQFVCPILPATEYYLSYDVKFEDGFDFKLGGKIPGLTSGGAKYTGGVNPDNGEGWSARYMWVGNKPIVYLYYVDMQHKYGESLELSTTLKTGKWYNFTQHIKVNSVGQQDALIEVWIDGNKVGSKENFRLRIGDQGLIDTFYFSTFHGGNTPEWAPSNDSYARFDNIRVYSVKQNIN